MIVADRRQQRSAGPAADQRFERGKLRFGVIERHRLQLSIGVEARRSLADRAVQLAIVRRRGDRAEQQRGTLADPVMASRYVDRRKRSPGWKGSKGSDNGLRTA